MFNTRKNRFKNVCMKDSPIGFWQFSETAGSVLSDLSGNSRDATLAGTYTQNQSGLFVPDRAVSFDGSSGRADAGNLAAWQQTGSLTVEALVKTSDIATLRCIVCKGSGEDYVLDINGTQFRFTVKRVTDNWLTVTTGALAAATTSSWYHVVGTWDGSTIKIFMNNQAGFSSTVTARLLQTSSSSLMIGARPGPDRFWNGLISAVAIYPSALSTNRIAEHYRAAFGLSQ